MQEVRELHRNQVAGFMVNPSTIKKDNGKVKTKVCSDGQRRRVYFSCNHLNRTGGLEPHPSGFQFVDLGEAPIS